MLCRDYKDKEADRMVTRIDPGVAALVAKLRGHERQAARGTGAVEDRRAAITLAVLMTTAELEDLEKRALEMEKSRGADDQVDQMSQALNRLRAQKNQPAGCVPLLQRVTISPIRRLNHARCS